MEEVKYIILTKKKIKYLDKNRRVIKEREWENNSWIWDYLNSEKF
jgi:hypothetical protein